MGGITSSSFFFGGCVKNGFDLLRHPDITPSPLEEPSNDPCMGFPSRTKRRTQLTEDEYYSMKLEAKDSDYCADLLLDYRVCRRDNWPFPVVCGHEKHAYLGCLYDDYVLRMKEYERERRLLARGIITKPEPPPVVVVDDEGSSEE